MSKPDLWMPLYIGDYLADTMHLDARDHGAYLLLIMHYWRSGPLPDDDRMLAGIARVDRRVWVQEVGPVVRAFFTATDGRLHQKRIDEEREHAAEVSGKRRDAANRRYAKSIAEVPEPGGGEPPGGQQQANGQPANGVQLQSKSNANAGAIAEQTEPHARTCASALPSPSPSKKDSVPSGTDAEPASPPPPARDLLWSQGVPLLHHLTGKSDGQCRGMLGRMLRDLQDDCPRLLLVLQQANQARPIDPVAWLTAATRPKDRPDRDEKILRAAGLWRDDAGPIVEHEEPAGMLGLPSPMRWHQ